MDEKAASEERTDSLYPMYFGVSSAFIVLEVLSRSEFKGGQWLEIRDKMLQASAYLLGILVWKIQRREVVEGSSEVLYKLGKAQIDVEELKKRRTEDAKANQKVVSIFASQEQSWLSEKRELKQQIGNLFNELRAEKIKKEEIVLKLNEELQAKGFLIQSRDKVLEEAEAKRKEVEEKLQRAEAVAVELRETIEKEAQKHVYELWKHKTTFMELVSNQRQLEAEMGRALRQVETAKQELDSAFKQKEESFLMVQQLSMEVVKIRKDSGQKEKILSAMLRKSKLDTAEKEMLLQELKVSKVKRKQAQLEMERRSTLYESRHERNSSRGNLFSRGHSKSEVFSGVKGVRSIDAGNSQNQRTGIHSSANRNNSRTLLHDYMEVERRKEWDSTVPEKTANVVSASSIQYLPERGQFESITVDVNRLEGWVRSEIKKNTTMLEQRHQLEIDAFAEQMRLKDEKLEAFRWQLLTMELETKQLQSHTEGLDKSLSQLRKENMKLEALLLGREAELKALNKGLTNLQGKASLNDLNKDHKAIWSEVKVIKTKPSEDVQTMRSLRQEVDSRKEEQIPIKCSVETNLIAEVPEKEIEVEKEVVMDTGYVGKQITGSEETNLVNKLEPNRHSLLENDACTWKIDLHSLGVSYNIKRLKQQLLLLDKLVGISRSCKTKEFEDNSHFGTKDFVVLMSLLKKQLSRYQSLQEKIDDLCKRMHENNLDNCGGGSRIAKTEKETKTLETFLEETLQLQRYMVATGQKLMEIQSRIASGFLSSGEDTNNSSSFDMKRFAASVRTIFKDLQKGLDVRIARVMGDLKGTLTCDGIIHS